MCCFRLDDDTVFDWSPQKISQIWFLSGVPFGFGQVSIVSPSVQFFYETQPLSRQQTGSLPWTRLSSKVFPRLCGKDGSNGM